MEHCCKQELQIVKTAYHEAYGRDLQQDLQIYTASDFMDILVALLEGTRDEGKAVDEDMARTDVEGLMTEADSSFQEENGTFKSLFTKRNTHQLRATLKKYQEVQVFIHF